MAAVTTSLLWCWIVVSGLLQRADAGYYIDASCDPLPTDETIFVHQAALTAGTWIKNAASVLQRFDTPDEDATIVEMSELIFGDKAEGQWREVLCESGRGEIKLAAMLCGAMRD